LFYFIKMGCNPSKDPKVGVIENNTSNPNDKYKNANGIKRSEIKNSQKTDLIIPPSELKPPLAFIVSFDENRKNGNMQRPPPARLRLEPLKPTPKLTQKELDDKMRAAEMKREQVKFRCICKHKRIEEGIYSIFRYRFLQTE
jgi:hypothetical protein